MGKTIEQLVNELDITEKQPIILYEILIGSGIRKKNWKEIRRYIEKIITKSRLVEKPGIYLILEAMARGYDDGLKNRGF